MDKFYLLEMALTGIIDELEQHAQQVRADLSMTQITEWELLEAEVKRWYQIIKSARQRLRTVEKECLEGIAFAKKGKRKRD